MSKNVTDRSAEIVFRYESLIAAAKAVAATPDNTSDYERIRRRKALAEAAIDYTDELRNCMRNGVK